MATSGAEVPPTPYAGGALSCAQVGFKTRCFRDWWDAGLRAYCVLSQVRSWVSSPARSTRPNNFPLEPDTQAPTLAPDRHGAGNTIFEHPGTAQTGTSK